MAKQGIRAAVLVEDGYEDLELWYPYFRLKEAGFEAIFVGTGKEQYKSKHGYPCKPEKLIDAVKVKDFDAVVIPGGTAPDVLRRYEAINNFVAECNKAGKVIAAICHAGSVLCSAQMLKGRKVTSFFAIRHDMEHAGADWSDAEVVVDGNLITSRKPDDLPAFTRELLKALEK